MSRVEFFTKLKEIFPLSDLRKTQQAYLLSKNMHRPQERDDGGRYFDHPVRVAQSVIDSAVAAHEHIGASTVMAALLHDILEDTYLQEDMIIALFGPVVCEYVIALTKKFKKLEPLTLEKLGEIKIENKEYYARIAAAPRPVRLIKICDRLDNVSDIDTFSIERRIKYVNETLQFVLPIAEITDASIAQKIKKMIEPFKDES